MENIVGKFVKVYKDITNKKNYEGDGIIIQVKNKNDNLCLCDIAFEDNIYTYIIDTNDILEY